MQSKMDLVGLNSRVLALIEQLVASGALDLRAFDERRKLVAEREAKRMNDEGHVRVQVDNTADKYALSELPEIDCHARLAKNLLPPRNASATPIINPNACVSVP